MSASEVIIKSRTRTAFIDIASPAPGWHIYAYTSPGADATTGGGKLRQWPHFTTAETTDTFDTGDLATTNSVLIGRVFSGQCGDTGD